MIIVLAGLVIWLDSSLARRGFTQADVDQAYQDGYTTGYDEAYGTGYGKGYEAGYDEGREGGITPGPGTGSGKLPVGAILWHDAENHIGERATANNPVCGPVVGTSYRPDVGGQPTWLNIGEDYPSQNRFVVIIWGSNRGKFPQAPEVYYLGKTICVTGLITEYRGIPQIEATDASQIRNP